jgi:DNA replication and repair protein RecF
MLGRLLVVMFMPDDLKLVKAGPAERRTFIDTEICQLSPVYTNELREYHRALKQRNHLLKSKGDYGSLFIWDEQLARHGTRIMRARAEFIRDICEAAGKIHSRITAGEKLTLEYQPNIAEPELYLDILKKGHDKDIIVGSTASGVHKDELQFLINGIPARNFGSQGQQRTAALSTKLAEIEIIKENTGLYPVLLLDDVLSELDENRQRFLIDQIGSMQVLLTCTGVEDMIRSGIGDCRVMRMENGNITEE